jgi:hypothetical protein
MTLDAKGDPTAMFLFRVLGPITAKDGASIQLANGAASSNAYFFSDTSVEIGSNTMFRAAAFSRGNVTIGDGSTAGKVISVAGDVYTRSAVVGEGTGFIEICKAQLAGTNGLEGLYFDFYVPGSGNQGFGTNIVRVPLGSCSGPIELPVGPVNIFEPGASTTAGGPENFQSYTLVSVTSPQDQISNVNGPQRSFTAQVTAGTPASERLINVTNRYAITGFVEICKYRTNANDTDVSGTWEFSIDVTGAIRYSTPVDQCTGPIFLVVPTTGGSTSGTVNIVEIARNNFINTGANTIPAGNLISFTPNTTISPDGTGRGGTAAVTVNQVTGGALNETVVNFFNATTPGSLKICKVAGPGIPLGTRFDFTVSGLQGPLPGTATTQTVRVAAGPIQQNGFCTFASGTFIVGSAVTVTEVLPPVDAVPGVPPAEIRVSQIASTTPVIAGPNLTTRTITVRAGQMNGTIVRYTNFVFRPTLLKICKIAGPGVAVGTNFTFDINLIDPLGFYPGIGPFTVTVAAGAGSQFGNCVFVNGPYTPIGTPPIGTFNVGQAVRIVERPTAGLVGGPVAAVGTVLDTSFAERRIDLLLTDPATNIAVYINAVPQMAGSVRADFDGDGRSDFATFGNGVYNISSPYQSVASSANIGQPGDLAVPGDYDGDHVTDAAVYRNGTWMIQGSGGGSLSVNWGTTGDIPVAADYDGDGKSDFGVFRPSTGTWYILRSSTNSGYSVDWGTSTDLPVPGDFDGDGKADVGVFRPSTGTWYVIKSTGGGMGTEWGTLGDRPVPADYDGDGKIDLAVFRPSNGTWYVSMSSGQDYLVVNWGAATDNLAPGDYDGDGRADIGVYRSGTWYVLGSRNGLMIGNFGGANDISVESRYIP